jgi:beta-lactamase regulating signal transducer with metallopeptidase domain
MWRNTLHGSVLIVAVLLVQRIFDSRLSPSGRYALWLLVLLRLALPWPLESPSSIFNFLPAAPVLAPSASNALPEPPMEGEIASNGGIDPAAMKWSLPTIFGWIWFAGAVSFLAALAASAFHVRRQHLRERGFTHSQVLELFEDCRAEMSVTTPVMLVESSCAGSPLLYGFLRPRLLLPAHVADAFSLAELRQIFLHELGHVKRMDVPAGWAAAVLLALHWFNPLVWLAFHRMRADRELACDALAMRYSGQQGAKAYGEAVIKVLERFSRPALGPGLVGIAEDKKQLTRRIQMIAASQHSRAWPGLGLVLFALLGALALTDAQKAEAADSATPAGGGVPQIVSTTPKIGATDVDSGLTELTVTFDRDMRGGFSWTGGGPEFPLGREGAKPHWKDKRTCALPVRLEAGKFYRVGINSTSHQNFRSAEGVPANPVTLHFTTTGASAAEKQRLAKPQVASMNPKNGAKNVSPDLTEIRVTFDTPMRNGFSWTGGGPQFPGAPGKKPYWTEDRRTCVLPVELKPGMEYRVGLNSVSHKNFKSESGVPLDPVVYTFSTK